MTKLKKGSMLPKTETRKTTNTKPENNQIQVKKSTISKLAENPFYRGC